MKRTFLAIVALLAGCASKSPYQYMENWIIRDDAVRPFSVHADLIYLQHRLYNDMSSLPSMTAYARSEVGGKRFAGIARVFSPLVLDAGDLENALDWYFSCQHTKHRPFVFIGEGAGGALLKAYEAENADRLKDAGLVASFYSEETQGGFVTDAMVLEIRNAISCARYRNQWGREVPEGMFKDIK